MSENSQPPVDYSLYGPLYAGWARLLSFLIACALSVLVLTAPQVIAESTQELKHGVLSLCMWGMCAGFVHGVGYVPVMHIWRYAFSPYVGWPVMGLCVALWL
jgi:cyd operon protein YbgE